MNYGAIKKHDIANGDGVRVSLFVSGCPYHCKGCFNPETWDYDYGQPFTTDTIYEILEALDKPYIQGLSVLGGEPLDPRNIKTVGLLLQMVRLKFGKTKDVWLYTGQEFKRAYNMDNGGFDDMILALEYRLGGGVTGLVDVIVDGPFIEEQKDPSLWFKGSSNQRIIDVKKSKKIGKVVIRQ